MNKISLPKLFLVIFVVLFTIGCGNITCNLHDNVITEECKPTNQLLELLNFFEIKTDGSLQDIVNKTQQLWLRPTDLERFNMQDLYADKKTQLMPIFKRLGLTDEVRPTKAGYDYALVHGGDVLCMRARISYLVGLWNSGIKFKTLVFLAGQRDLDKKSESVGTLQAPFVEKIRKQAPWLLAVKKDWKFIPATMPFESETDMIRIVYEQTDLPDDFRSLPVIFIDAPKQINLDGQLRRPNTEDTINSWLQTKPSAGSCLFITNQPFVGYQDSMVRTLLANKNFEIETIGFAIQQGYDSVSMILDSLARWLYQENIRKTACC